MARKKRSQPTKNRIKKGSSHLSNTTRKDSKETQMAKLTEIVKAQEFIDKWNLDYVGSIGMADQNVKEHFNNVQLEDGLVIQMYMENPVKKIMTNEDTGEVVHVDYGVRQIDYRSRNTDKSKWGPTPFPVIDKGMILAVSPRTKLWYYEQKEKLAKYDPAAAEALIIPEVGDVVYTKHFMFKDKRYYINKQDKCEDFVKNQEELRLRKFDFLFLIDNYDIESIVKADRAEFVSDHQKTLDERYEHVKVQLTPTEPELEQHLVEDETV